MPAVDPFIAAVARSFVALGAPSPLVVAVSGGADSVALLTALAAAVSRRSLRHVEVVAAHVDHGLRADSAADAVFVRALADRLALRSLVDTVRIDARGHGLEEAAREARYDALRRMALQVGAKAVATGHTATDQAETLILRLLRGTGLRGLGGMAPTRDLGGVCLVRPLLGLTREDTEAFCDRHRERFLIDPTNVDERPRARVRAEVLPVLDRLAPGAVRRLASTANALRLEDEALDRLATLGADEPALRRRAVLSFVARTLGSRRRLSAVHVDALDRLVETGRGEVELPATKLTRRVALVRSGQLVVEERPRVKKREG